MSFGCRLKKLRNEKKLSQASLALELGVSSNAVSQYETGKRFPDQKILVKICLFFEVSSDYLLGLSDVPRSSAALTRLSFICDSYSDAQIEAINALVTAFSK